jgi:outer membrane protein insertion porin family
VTNFPTRCDPTSLAHQTIHVPNELTDDEADRMKDSTYTSRGRLTSWLAITGSLVCLSGCAALNGPPQPQPGPFSAQPAAAATGAGPAFGTPGTGLSGDANGVILVSDQSAGEHPTTTASNVQTTGSDRYIARQYPSGAASGPGFMPPSVRPPATTTTLAPPTENIPLGPPAPSATLVPSLVPQVPAPNFQPGPRVRQADLVINGFPARTGRIMLGGAVNSDAGITGQLTVDERNFDITRWPHSFRELFSGNAFRGAGQTFRLEAAPGSDFQRYTLQFADPNLFGYKPVSMSVSGFLFDRRFNDWDEERIGGRLAFGYRVTPDLSVSAGVSGQSVRITRPRIVGVPQLDDVVGKNSLYGGEVSLKHDTRDSPIQAGRGHYFDFSYEQVFGDYDYARFEIEYRKYWMLAQRADGSGRQTVSYSTKLGFSGDDTPIFEDFFAGGYATIRGFDFRGASPVVGGVEVGGRFQWLNTVEYMFPITADDAFRGVAFVDFGTVEQDIEINKENYRVAPGVGLRVAIPMLGPAPLAFDFAYPVAKADTDQKRVFSFYMSLIR